MVIEQSELFSAKSRKVELENVEIQAIRTSYYDPSDDLILLQ